MAGVVIDFSARDNGVQSLINNTYKKLNQEFNNFTSTALANSKSGKEQLALLEAQIRVTERRNKLEKEASLLAIENRKKELLLSNQAAREQIDTELKKAKQDFRKGDITEQDYIGIRKRLSEEKKYVSSDKEIESEAKDKSKLAEDRLKEDQFQTKLMGELVDSMRQATISIEAQGKAAVEAFIKGVEENPEAEDKDRIIAALLTEKQNEKKKEEKKDDVLTKAAAGMAAYNAFSKVLGGVNSLVGTQTGFDQITNVSSLVGQGIGALLGGTIGGFTTGGVGAVTGASLGATAGGEIASIFGGLTQREKETAEEYGKAVNRYIAATGATDYVGSKNYSKIGMDYKEMTELQTEVSRKMGTSRGSEREAINVASLERGYGIERGITTAMIEMQRSNIGGQKDLVNTIGGILDKGRDSIFAGGDRTMLPEVLQKFSSLQKEFLKTQNSVKDGTVADVMFRFNKLGGQFALKDYRSEGLISGIQNSLSNPGSDVMKSLSFQALRRLNPNMDLSQIIEERQKGLGSSNYLRSILGSLDQMGGSTSSKIMNIAGAFGLEGNMAAARSIYENREALMSGSIDAQKLISSTTSEEKIKKEAGLRTTQIEENYAELQNQIILGMSNGAKAIKKAIEEAFDNSTITITSDGRAKYTNAVKNSTKVPDGKVTREDIVGGSMVGW